MKPIDQTTFGDKKGNCLSACLASILELPLDYVPNFCVDYSPESWWGEMQKWLNARGVIAIEVELNDHLRMQVVPGMYCVLSGKSPRGEFDHSVVGWAKGTELFYVHDPHPDHKFLDGLPRHVMFLLGYCPVASYLADIKGSTSCLPISP